MCILGYPGKCPSVLCKSSVTACLLNLCLQLKGKKILLISEYIRRFCHLQLLSAHYRSSRYFDSKVVLYPSFASFLASYLQTQQIKYLSLGHTEHQGWCSSLRLSQILLLISATYFCPNRCSSPGEAHNWTFPCHPETGDELRHGWGGVSPQHRQRPHLRV